MEKRQLKIGDKGYFHKTITEADVCAFAGVTGDFSRIHMDAEFAKTTRYGQRIVHGLLTSSFISTVMGMTMPGSGTVFLDEYVKFKAPVFFGDTITAEVTLSSVDERSRSYIGEFTGICKNQKGEVVVEATCHEMMPKEFFEIS